MNRSNIVAIIVAYFPNKEIITNTIKSIYQQVSKLYIIDNTPNGSNILKNHELLNGKNCIELITLNENVGIAKAQNIGICRALEDGAKYILLSDQDTQYSDNHVSKLIEVYSKMKNKENVAAVAPDVADLNNGGKRLGFMVFEGFFVRRIFPLNGCYEISQALASGMLISSEALKQIGLMDETLFVDWVDFEWCWKARAKGYKIIGCADVIVKHHLGDQCIDIIKHPWGDLTKKIMQISYTVRSPIRDYYIIRNTVYLALKSKYINFGMRLNILIKYCLGYTIAATILSKPHWKHFTYCLTGFCHGIRKKLGSYK